MLLPNSGNFAGHELFGKVQTAQQAGTVLSCILLNYDEARLRIARS